LAITAADGVVLIAIGFAMTALAARWLVPT
jgi:hypothetical protein